MPDPTVEAQIEAYLASLVGYSEDELNAFRQTLNNKVILAEAGDAQAQGDLAEVGIVAGRRQPGFMDWLGSAAPWGDPTLPGGPFAPRWPEEPTPEPSGAVLTPPTPGPELGAGVTEGPFPGTFWYTDPASGKRLLVEESTDLYGNPSLRILDEIAAGAATGRLAPTGDLKNYAYLYQEGLITRDEYDAAVGSLMAGGGPPTLTPYQAGQLEISRARLAIEREEAGRRGLETQIQAARTGQPLTYLSLLRGQVPGAGGTEIYQGLRPVVPGITEARAPAEGEGWQAPPMPPGMAAVAAGRPLAPAGLPSGTLRPPGVQAQAAMSPFEAKAYGEAAEYQRIPPMDWEAYQARMRKGVGPGIGLASYGGRLRS